MQVISPELQTAIDATSARVDARVHAEWDVNQFATDAIPYNASGWYIRWWKSNSEDYDEVDLTRDYTTDSRYDSIDFTDHVVDGQADYIQARAEGYIIPPITGTYTFYLTADRGVRMYVNDELVVQKYTAGNYSTTGAQTYTYTKYLEAGIAYKVVVDYFHRQNAQRLALEWATTGLTREYITLVDSDGFEPDGRGLRTRFGIANIIKPRRPSTGLPKAFVNQSYVSGTRHTRVCSSSSKFEYWASPEKSKDTYEVGTGYPISWANPRVIYDKSYTVNKLQAKFEVTWSRPEHVDVYITTDGRTWTQVADALTVPSNGRITLYLQDNDTWGTTLNLTNSTTVRGVRFHIRGMNKADARAMVLEIRAAYQIYLSDRIINVSIDKVREEQDQALPVGYMKSSTASITLDNSDGRFNPENTNSDLKDYIDQNAKFNIEIGYDTSVGLAGTGYQYIQQGVFYVDSWGGLEQVEANVELTDYSKFLQEIFTPEMLYTNKYSHTIARDLLEACGINAFNYYQTSERFVIPYCWFNEETTLWEALSSIAKAERSVFYFDEFEQMVYEGRTRLQDRTVDEQIRSDLNLVDINSQFNVEANRIIVPYSIIEPNQFKRQQRMAILWEPQEDIVLNSSQLTIPMNDTQTHMMIERAKIDTWPYTGELKIESEIISYSGKEYILNGNKYTLTGPTYYDTATGTLIDTQQDSGYFSGRLMNLKRGLYGTDARTHRIDMNGWTFDGWSRSGSNKEIVGGKLVMSMDSSADGWYLAYRGKKTNRYGMYGTSIKFTRENSPHNIGGMVINLQNDGKRGYYIELGSSEYATATKTNELKVYRFDDNDQRHFFGQGTIMKVSVLNTYTMDVIRKGNHYSIYVNGDLAYDFEDSTYTQGKWGVFLRANTKMEVDYFYALSPKKEPAPKEHAILHRPWGYYISGYPWKIPNDERGAEPIFDDFGCTVHERRIFNVKFENFPALNAYVLNSNRWESNAQPFRYTPFGASFAVENISRNDATLQGADTSIITGTDIQQNLLVSGQTLVRREDQQYIVEDLQSQRRNGKIEAEVSSPWIQSKEMAETIGNWIRDRWSKPVDTIEVEWVPNPAIQLGDVVTLNYPEKDIFASEYKYHVIGSALNYDGALSGSLTLRRIHD